jgi:TetR/AcrR family transcriptional regulator, transcriptional repressor for nem operon
MTEAVQSIKGGSNRQRIIRAAYELFYQKGFNQTSFSDIAEAADFPRGNFYYYFKSKDALLKEVVRYRIDLLKEMMVQWDQGSDDPAQRLLFVADMMEATREDVIRYGCPLGTLTAELGKTQEDLQGEAVQMLNVIIAWTERQLEALGYGEQAHILAMHLMSRLQGVTMMAFSYGDRAFIDYEIQSIRQELERLGRKEPLYDSK